MKGIKILSILILLGQPILFGQETVTTTVKYGFENPELQELFEFQNIGVEKFEFESPKINGKYYQVFIKEYKTGKLIDSKILFDGTEIDQFKINSRLFDFKIFTEISKNNLKIQLRSKKYASANRNYELTENSSEYATKDFFGAKIAIENPLSKEFPLLAIITPTKHSNGFSSYCEVVQSDIAPEKLGEHFNIPHYFLITMAFK
ncbi:hypothetical protein [Flagellimonas amoyensis]|uniref:hypothetical protein n=1 Tax=Flagellimonas amoyensis TaxID=2169401 RepID=UPI000D3B3787|nr:hypothetical protein [Allomuricauda amoyensis]